MAFEVGKPLSVQLVDGTALKGFVHAEDAAAGLVCLELIPSADLTLLPISNVKSATPIPDLADSRKWPANLDVDLPRLKAEQERIFRKRHIEFTHIGVGVTPEGQAVFDVLAKTLPCEWEGNVIVVFGTVRLGPPYDIKSIRGDADAATAVNRVRMVLERRTRTPRPAEETNGVAS